jgi:hypothetical protein
MRVGRSPNDSRNCRLDASRKDRAILRLLEVRGQAGQAAEYKSGVRAAHWSNGLRRAVSVRGRVFDQGRTIGARIQCAMQALDGIMNSGEEDFGIYCFQLSNGTQPVLEVQFPCPHTSNL